MQLFKPLFRNKSLGSNYKKKFLEAVLIMGTFYNWTPVMNHFKGKSYVFPKIRPLGVINNSSLSSKNMAERVT